MYALAAALGLALAGLLLIVRGLPPPDTRPAADALCTLRLRTPSGAELEVEVAADPDARQRGLSGRPSLVPGAALALAFPQPQPAAIWMKDMRFAIDAVWLVGQQVVDLIERIPPPDPGTPPDRLAVYEGRMPADAVLELAAGSARRWGLVPGARVAWRPAPPGTACNVR